MNQTAWDKDVFVDFRVVNLNSLATEQPQFKVF